MNENRRTRFLHRSGRLAMLVALGFLVGLSLMGDSCSGSGSSQSDPPETATQYERTHDIFGNPNSTPASQAQDQENTRFSTDLANQQRFDTAEAAKQNGD